MSTISIEDKHNYLNNLSGCEVAEVNKSTGIVASLPVDRLLSDSSFKIHVTLLPHINND